MSTSYATTGSGTAGGFTGTGGWTCQWCRGWVPSGVAHHVCPTQTGTTWVNPPPPPVPQELERVAAALERIATQLEGAD